MSDATFRIEPLRPREKPLTTAAEQRFPGWGAYSRAQFDGDPPLLLLPTDYPRKALQTFRAATQPLVIGKSLSEAIEALRQREGVSLLAILLAGFEALLYSYTGQDDIALGSTRTHHKSSETEEPSEPQLHYIVLSTSVSGNPSFQELIKQVQEVTLAGFFPLEVPLEPPRGEPQFARDHSLSMPPKVFFSLRSEIPECASSWLATNNGAGEYDLELELADGPEGIFGRFSYNADLFDAGTIARMVGHWRTLLEGAIADPGRRLSELPLLDKAEQHQLLVEWNDTKADYPAVCLHELIQEQVERTPDNVAVVFEDQQLSYRELNARANQLGHYLQETGVGPEVLVGICVERSLEMVVGLLGILKAGGTYVPLDPNYPKERLALMVEDSQLKVLLTQEQLRTKLSDFPAQLICLDSQRNALSQESLQNCRSGVGTENLAYVIYTSGSTGKPKGVQISHRALVNFLTSMQAKPGMNAKDILLAVTTISFDIAGLELYLPLTVGARVVLVSRETASDGERLREKLATSGATCMQATPATWRLLLESAWQGRKNLKILCGGEAVPRDLVNRLAVRASSVWNMYGPTETTIWSTVHRVRSSEGPVAIGRPIANTQIYILNRFLQPAPIGISGELYIGGDGVARGYLHRATLTTERFIPNPFCEQVSGARLYRTGDLARYRPDGEIECLGRIDDQVKVRGFRIELGEIEAALAEHAGVYQNVVILREDEDEKQLVAYVVPAPGRSPSIMELRNHLKRRLPDYMLPSRFIFLGILPLTPNGKVNRRALQAPPQLELSKQKEYVAPRNASEAQLVKIWESVLSVRTVGVKENFFELGGHSLLAAKLLHRIERAFERKLPMAALFQAPTIEQQAIMLCNNSAVPCSSAVIPIQPAGSRPPLFFFGFMAGPLFLPLARRLGADQPLFGVDANLLESSQLRAPYTMEGIAACLVKEIRKVQPTGPYRLGGFCVGGLMAYESARQLVAHGEEIALLALVETPAYTDGRWNGSLFDGLRQRLRFHFGNLRKIGIKEGLPYLRGRAGNVFHYLRELGRETFYDVESRMNDGRLQEFIEIVRLVARAYPVRPFNGRVTLFHAVNRNPAYDRHRQRWEELATTLEVHEIPGYSSWVERFFLEPQVEVLAQKLACCLARPQEENKGLCKGT